MGYFMKGLYQITAIVFGGISWAINQFYAMVLTLSKIDIFKEFEKVQDKVFALMGLFMLFKLAFSVIQYVVDPDKLTNSQTGFQKIIVRVVVVLALLGTIGNIFDEAMVIQEKILTNHVLEKIVFSEESSGVEEGVDEKTGLANDKNGKYLAFAVLAPFIKFNDAAFEDVVPDGCEASPFLSRASKGPEGTFSCGSCCAIMAEQMKNYDAFKKAVDGLNMSKALLKGVGFVRKFENGFTINWVLGPVVGIICLVILIIICVNVAIRAIKLSFLRLIAPIPIISYVDPNDKDGMFKKWLKVTIDTYLDLFIRLIAFFFSVYIVVNLIANNQLSDKYDFLHHPLLYVFFLIGTLMFAMQLPKLIKDLTGADTSGLEKGMKRGASILGATALGGVGGVITGFMAGRSNGKLGISDALSGGLGSAVRSGWNARNGQNLGNVLSSTRTGITQTGVVRNANAIEALNGRRVRSRIPFASSIRASFGSMAGLKNTTAGQKYLSDDRKYYNNVINASQNEISDWTKILNNSQSQQNASSSEIARLKSEINSQVQGLRGFGGSYDQSTGDYELTLDGKKRSLNSLTRQEFHTAATQSMSKLTSEHAKGNISDAVFNDLKSNLDRLQDINQKDFDNLKVTMSQLHSDLQSEQTNWNAITANVSYTETQINEQRKVLQNAQEGLRTTEKNITTLNNVNNVK